MPASRANREKILNTIARVTGRQFVLRKPEAAEVICCSDIQRVLSTMDGRDTVFHIRTGQLHRHINDKEVDKKSDATLEITIKDMGSVILGEGLLDGSFMIQCTDPGNRWIGIFSGPPQKELEIPVSEEESAPALALVGS